MKRYIHTKTGNPYSLVTDNFMFKDNGEWRKNLCLYKTEYHNPDGEYFARTREDFDENFKPNESILTKEETLKKLQELQLKYLGEIDMTVRYEIETRKDQKCTMVVSYCNYTENFEKKSKLFIHKFYWDKDNTFEFKQMELEIEELRKKYK